MSEMNEPHRKQRFGNYRRVIHSLVEAKALSERRPLTPLEKHGVIRTFETAHELSLKLLKEHLGAIGVTGLIGPRDVYRAAVLNDLTPDHEIGRHMIEARRLTPECYDGQIADALTFDSFGKFLPAFVALETTLLRIDESGIRTA